MMQTSEEIRRTRLGLLVEKMGVMANLCQRLGYARNDTAKLTRILNANVRHERGGKTYNMGDALAREIEEGMGLERGWMDNPISAAEQAGTGNQRAKIAQLMDSLPEDQLAVALRLLDALAKPAEGNGTSN